MSISNYAKRRQRTGSLKQQTDQVKELVCPDVIKEQIRDSLDPLQEDQEVEEATSVFKVELTGSLKEQIQQLKELDCPEDMIKEHIRASLGLLQEDQEVEEATSVFKVELKGSLKEQIQQLKAVGCPDDVVRHHIQNSLGLEEKQHAPPIPASSSVPKRSRRQGRRKRRK